MRSFLAIAVLACVGMAQLSLADANGSQKSITPPAADISGPLGTLPPAPSGKSTVIGGQIRDVDHVHDQFTLKVFGGQSLKILFDARTQFYRDGVRTPLRTLGPEGHASVETVLDGTNIFARSVHVLSQVPEGEYQGQILAYDPATRELTVSAALSHEPITLRVPAGTPIVAVGQAARHAEASNATADASSLVKGALISVKFQSDTGHRGRGIARQIAILASPGSAFVFRGNISFLNLSSKVLVLTDPRDGKSYKITFDPDRFPVSRQLHEGNQVTVTADFDGTRYVASAITIR